MTNDLFRNPFPETASFSVAVVRLAYRCNSRDPGAGHNLATHRQGNWRASNPALRFSCQFVFWLKSPDSVVDLCHFDDAVCKTYKGSPATSGDFTHELARRPIQHAPARAATSFQYERASKFERDDRALSVIPSVRIFRASSCQMIPVVPRLLSGPTGGGPSD